MNNHLLEAVSLDDAQGELGQVDNEAGLQLSQAHPEELDGLGKLHVGAVVPVQEGEDEMPSITMCSKWNFG